MAEIALQTALYNRLSGASIGASVYDVPQQDTAFPYVTCGRIIMTGLDTQTKNGFSALIRIHTFSQTGSMLECKTIQGAIYDALHHSVLTVTGHSNFFLSREATDCMVDEDGKLHGVCEYRALIETA